MAYIHFIGLIQGPEHSRHLCHFIYTGDCAHICVNGDAWIYPKGDLERAKYICIKLAVYYTYYIALTNVYVQCILYNVNYTFIKEGFPVMRKVVSPKEHSVPLSSSWSICTSSSSWATLSPWLPFRKQPLDNWKITLNYLCH